MSRQTATRLQDLARIANVSIATVSRALNDSPVVNADTKQEIWRIAREQHYPFKPHMPAMATGAAASIGIVIPPPQRGANALVNPFYLELIGGVCEAAREAGCDIAISHAAPKNYDDLSAVVGSSRTAGVIFLGQSVLHERFNQLAAAQKRFIVWGAELPGQRYCAVGSDNVGGGRRATAHLIRLGRKRIAFFGDVLEPEVAQRFEGYARALDAAGFDVEDDLTAAPPFEVDAAEQAVGRLIDRRTPVDAIFCASGLAAVGAVRGLKRAGLRVPEDVSVVGYDDIQLARYASPTITTIAQNTEKAGRILVSKLVSASDETAISSERLPIELIVRESCGG
ncbi:MAG: substrate-binding domain-containing protein [Pseudomonadota bacterium]